MKRYVFFAIILLFNLPTLILFFFAGRIPYTSLLFIIDLSCVLFFIKRVEKTSIPDSELTRNEKIQVIVTELLGGTLIPGAFYYYCWKSKFPHKANQANKFTFIIFGISMLIVIISTLTGFHKFF